MMDANKWVDGQMGRRTGDGWVDGQVELIHEWVDIDGWMDIWMNG